MAEAFAPRALVFDAYGTLFDVLSVGAACEERFPGKGADLSRLWRTKQLEYSWLRSLMGRYATFEAITLDALRFSCRALGLALAQADAEALLGAYRRLETFPEVIRSLEALAGCRKAILSNGSPAMLEAIVEHAGLSRHFDAVISVDDLQVYKPSPEVYELAMRRLGLARNEAGFVSSNFWDVTGATSFGLRAFWVNRANAPRDELGFQPYRVIGGLDQLAGELS